MLDYVIKIILEDTGLDIKQKTRKREVAYMRFVYFKISSMISSKSHRSIALKIRLDHSCYNHAIINFDTTVKKSPMHYAFYKKLVIRFKDFLNLHVLDIDQLIEVKKILKIDYLEKISIQEKKDTPKDILSLLEMIPETHRDNFKETKLIPFLAMLKSDRARVLK